MSILEQNYNRVCNKISDINEHLPTLKKYASECEHITEIGVRAINSTWGRLAGKPKKLISYDIFFAGPPIFPDADIASVFAAAREENIVYGFIQQSSLEANIEPTDLLFLDTWHVYEQLSRELLYHSDKAKKYIILHDTTYFAHMGEYYEGCTNFSTFTPTFEGKGLWDAIEDFLSRNRNWELCERFTNNNGLTILKRKNGTYEL